MEMKGSSAVSINQFAEEMKGAVQELLQCEVEIHEVVKNNNTHLVGLILKKEEKVSSIYYLEGAYEAFKAGANFNSLVVDFVENHKRQSPPDMDVSWIEDFERAKARVFVKIVNSERNAEMLNKVPSRIVVGDLAAIFYVVAFADDRGRATAVVNNHLAEIWGVDADALYALALENSQREQPASVKGMFETLEELNGAIVFGPEVVPLKVATNSSRQFGASVLLYEGLLRDYAREIGGDFWILPSTVHELLFLPVTGFETPGNLAAMVHDVNRTQVAPDEFLSDHVYVYRKDRDKVLIAS